MKTTNYILPLAAFAAGALFAKSQSGAVSGIGSTSSAFDELVKRVKEDTHHNDHTGSLIEIAKYFKATNLVNILTCIEKINIIEGHIPGHLGAYRNKIYNRLKQIAKDRLTVNEFDLLIGSL